MTEVPSLVALQDKLCHGYRILTITSITSFDDLVGVVLALPFGDE